MFDHLKQTIPSSQTMIIMLVFICLDRQTKQIMVAKFQTLVLLIANAESSPLFEAITSLYMYTNAEKFRGDHCVKIV
jgi:lipoprotein signal peptidase